jgi:hypothetical protein
VNVIAPTVSDGENGLWLVHVGIWDNYPTKYEVKWKIDGNVVQYGNSYSVPEGAVFTVDVIASNDDGSTTLTISP